MELTKQIVPGRGRRQASRPRTRRPSSRSSPPKKAEYEAADGQGSAGLNAREPMIGGRRRRRPAAAVLSPDPMSHAADRHAVAVPPRDWSRSALQPRRLGRARRARSSGAGRRPRCSARRSSSPTPATWRSTPAASCRPNFKDWRLLPRGDDRHRADRACGARRWRSSPRFPSASSAPTTWCRGGSTSRCAG